MSSLLLSFLYKGQYSFRLFNFFLNIVHFFYEQKDKNNKLAPL